MRRRSAWLKLTLENKDDCPGSIFPGVAEGKPQGVDSRVGLGLSAIGHVLVKDAGAEGPIGGDHMFDAAANEPGQREVLALAALDTPGVEQAEATARSAVQAPFAPLVPEFHRGRTHHRDVVGFRAILNPASEQGQPVADQDPRAVGKNVTEGFRRAPGKLRGDEPVGNGCPGADFPQQAGFDVKRGGFPRKFGCLRLRGKGAKREEQTEQGGWDESMHG